MPPDTLCSCRSERAAADCHDRANSVAYEPVATLPRQYAVPTHLPAAVAADLARSIADAGPYQIEATPTTWSLTQSPPRVPFRIIPLLRDRAPDGTPDMFLVGNAFQGISNWIPAPYPTQAQHTQAAQDLISAALQWDPERFFAIREPFAALLNRQDAVALSSALPSIARNLKTALPQATIDVVRSNSRAISAVPIARLLAVLKQVDHEVIRRAFAEGPTGRGGPFYSFDPAPYFELLANINYPRTYAFGIRLGLEAHVIVDYGQEITLAPQEATERRARDIGGRLLMAPHKEAFETKNLSCLTLKDRHFMRAWLTARINFLYSHLASVYCADALPDGSIDTSSMWKDSLTIEDIVALTQLIATCSDPAMLRLLFFDLMDRYCQLGGDSSRKIGALLNDDFINTLAEALDLGLGSVREPIRLYLLDAWDRVREGLWAGVLSETDRTARRFNTSPPGQAPDILDAATFPPKLLAAMRNTTHGYHLNWKLFERFLTRHSGLLPDAVRELAIALWLGFMSAPERFWPSPTRFTQLHPVVVPPPG